MKRLPWNTGPKMRPWVMLPSQWIEDGGLKEFRWRGGEGGNHTAALMTLAVIAHHTDKEHGIARLSYDALSYMASISRAKVSAALDILEAHGIIEREPDGRSTYALADYNPLAGWAKLPAKGLYESGRVAALSEFRLRRAAELNAMKLYLLFAARRSTDTNTANITYDGITERSGVGRDHIRAALSVLGANGLVHIERLPSKGSEHGIYNAYRLTHLDSNRHPGTTWRKSGNFDIAEL